MWRGESCVAKMSSFVKGVTQEEKGRGDQENMGLFAKHAYPYGAVAQPAVLGRRYVSISGEARNRVEHWRLYGFV